MGAVEDNGMVLRGKSETFTAGSSLNIETDFLREAYSLGDAPEIQEIWFELTGSVGGVTATALGKDAPKLFENIKVVIPRHTVYDVSGALARVFEQCEYGERQRDPATVASGSTNTSYSATLRLPFAFEKCIRERDTALPVPYLVEGGSIKVKLASAVPTGWAAVQSDWRVTPYALVKDGRNKEAKSMFKVWEQTVTQLESFFPVDGSLRNAILSSVLTTTGHTSLSAVVAPDSKTLGWPAGLTVNWLKDKYIRHQYARGSNDEFDAGNAIQVYGPDRFQRTNLLPDLQSLHLDLNVAVPTSATMLFCAIVDRDPLLTARWFGYQSAAEYIQAIAEHGVMVDEHRSDPNRWDDTLTRRIPMRIQPEVRARAGG